jgi:hypothetical protein
MYTMIYYYRMIYLFYGTDQKKVGDQVQSIVNALKAKREFAQVFHVYADSFSKDDLEGLQSSGGLFFDKHVFVYKDLLTANKDIREYMTERLAGYISSPHMHIFVEDELDEKDLKGIEKYKEITIKKYNKPFSGVNAADIPKKIFSVVSAIAGLRSLEKDKRTSVQRVNVWKTVDEIRRAGTAPEEFFGILWWRYRSMMQSRGVTQKVSGLTPYSYTEANKLAGAYDKRAEKGALQADMKELLDIYHDAHNGECEMWEALEGWILGA